MNLFTKIVLKFLSIASLIAQIFCGFAGIMLVFATVALFFVPEGIKKDMLQLLELNSKTNISVLFVILSCLAALAIISCLFIIMFALYKIIGNIYEQDFFVSKNLKYLKLILIAITSFTILQFISQLFFAKLHVYDVSSVFSNTSPGFLGNILILAIVYTLYVVFKYGISLQDDSNKVI